MHTLKYDNRILSINYERYYQNHPFQRRERAKSVANAIKRSNVDIYAFFLKKGSLDGLKLSAVSRVAIRILEEMLKGDPEEIIRRGVQEGTTYSGQSGCGRDTVAANLKAEETLRPEDF